VLWAPCLKSDGASPSARAPPGAHHRLIVGEGYAEVALIKHLRALYTCGGAGFAVTVYNARGFEAGQVVRQAIRQGRGLRYDHSAALLDTDAGWTEAIQATAQRNRIDVVPSDPCLEAWLLDIAGYGGLRDTPGHKREFERRFGFAANDPRCLVHFPRAVLDGARHRVGPLNALLLLMGV